MLRQYCTLLNQILHDSLHLIQGGDYHVISDSVKCNTAEALFILIGERIVVVLEDYLAHCQDEEARPGWELGPELPVGVTFSFPMM